MFTNVLTKTNAGWLRAALLVVLLCRAAPATAGVAVLTYHNDNTRTGQNTNETVLTPANVGSTNFGKIFSQPVDGYVYAEPLVVTNVTIPGQGVHDVVYVATEHDSVYAFDANSNSAPLWQVSFINPAAGITTVSSTDVNCEDVVPEIGITSTPVIDLASGTIYVVAKTKEVTNLVPAYYHRLHALDLATGAEKFGGPVVVQATVAGTGDGNDGAGHVPFDPLTQHQRAALLLHNGIVYIGSAAHCDNGPYHGWLIGYGAQTLALSNVFNTTPNAGLGGIWQAGGGPACDSNGNIYVETGNGAFDGSTNNDYGDSFLKLSTTNGLNLADYFTPYNQLNMDINDQDLGSGGPVVLPDEVGDGGANQHLLVGSCKAGTIYLINRDNMGQYNSTNDSQIVQSLTGAIGPIFGMPAYFNHQIYFSGLGDVLKSFVITNAQIVTTPTSQSGIPFVGFPRATPSVSANGTSNAILWAVGTVAYKTGGPAVLHAYDATNLAVELYNSSSSGIRDVPGGAVKFAVPTVANGKVYVGAQYELAVYGLGTFLAAPVISPAGGTFTNAISVTITDASPGTVIYYTLDGTTPTTGSTLYTGPFVLTSSAGVNARAVRAGAVDSAVTGVTFYSSTFTGNGTGLAGAYYSNQLMTFTNPPTLVRTDATVNFDWGSGGPDPSVSPVDFAVMWTGALQPQFNETYTFYTTTDDGVRLWVNGQLIVDHWVDQLATEWSGSIALSATQPVPITMEYYQHYGVASASLAWSSPSTPGNIIPQSQLYPNYPLQILPVVTWAVPAGIVYGTPLGTNQNNATSAVPGQYVYNPTNGTVLPAGTNTLTVVYTPTDTNYTGTNLSVQLVVTPAPLTVTVNNASMTYGQTNPVLGGTLTGVVNNDNVTATYATAATTGSPAGSYLIVPILLDPGGVLINYNVTTNSGTLTVNPAVLGITANNTNRVYGAANPIFTYTAAGFVNGDTVGVLGGSPSLTTTAVANSPAGSYAIVATNGTLTSTNYSFSFTNGVLTVNFGLPVVTWAVPSCIVYGTALGTNQNNATCPVPGQYLYNPTNGTVLPAGTNTLTVAYTPTDTNYTGTNLSVQLVVTPAPLTVTANNASMTYGQTNPVLGGTLTGVVNNDNVTATYATAATTGSPAGSYLIVPILLDPNGLLVNYNVTTNSGTLTVNPAVLGITANNTNRVYGAANPIFTYTAAGFVNGDTVGVLGGSPSLTTTAVADSPAGSYAIVATNGTLTATNYSFSFTNGVLTVNLGAPVITPDGGTFTNSISVTITDASPGTVIYYTLDGTTPTAGSTLYTGPFILTSSAGVNALASMAGAMDSVVTSAIFYSSTFTGIGTGLAGAYYSNQLMTFTNPPTLVRTDATVNFDWGSGSPDPSISVGEFTVMWTGAVQPQFNEIYTFYTTTEDGVRLWVNGQLIVDEWINQPATEWSGSIALPAGRQVPITMEYYQDNGVASASLAWSSPSTAKSIIPQSQLYPSYPPQILPVTGVNTNGQLNLQMAGLVGKGYVLQATTNLVSWVSIQTNAPAPDPDMALPTNLFNFSDPATANFPQRFYRGLQEP